MTIEEFKITFLPDNKSVSVKHGADLLTAAIKAGVNIYNSCGGEGVCARCKVIVNKGKYASELSGRISDEERKKGYVLACRTVPESDMEITIPEESRIADVEILTKEGR